jgi:hypothetical protein
MIGASLQCAWAHRSARKSNASAPPSALNQSDGQDCLAIGTARKFRSCDRPSPANAAARNVTGLPLASTPPLLSINPDC